MHNAKLNGIRLGTAALLALGPLCALGQGEAIEDAAEPRRYAVEVIVFRYKEDVSVGSEIFIPESAPEDFPDTLPDGGIVYSDRPEEEPARTAVEPAAPQDADEIGFVPLAPEEYSLIETYRRLQRLDVYEPLLHAGWSQTTHAEELTRPIDLFALADAPPGLEGSFKLYLSRYLHLVVDLTLDATGGSPARIDDSAFGYRDRRSVGAGSTGRLRYQITEDRIFKSGDLRYFDHPKFGVLAKITRIEEGADDIEQEMLGYGPDQLPGGDSQ